MPCYRHARLPALHCGDFLHGLRDFLAWTGDLHLTLSGQHWRCRSSRPVQPLKAAPSSGADRDRASRAVVTSHGCGRRLPAPPTERLRGTPSVNGDGTGHNMNINVRQVYMMHISQWRPFLRPCLTRYDATS